MPRLYAGQLAGEAARQGRTPVEVADRVEMNGEARINFNPGTARKTGEIGLIAEEIILVFEQARVAKLGLPAGLSPDQPQGWEKLRPVWSHDPNSTQGWGR